MKNIILASQSARRHALMKQAGFEFETIVSSYEEVMQPGDSAMTTVLTLATGKGLNVYQDHTEDIVVSADTIVYFDGKRQGKPKTEEELTTRFKSYSGNTVEIWTGTCIAYQQKVISQASSATVTFDTLSDELIKNYLQNSKQWSGIAGGFSFEEGADDFTHYKKEEFDIILGLDMNFVKAVLGRIGS